MRIFFFIFPFFFTNFALSKDVINIIANKYQEMPVSVINAHNPDSITFNKTFLENKPASLNALSAINGISSIEYQQNTQDSGGHTGVSINQLPFYYTSIFVDGIYIPESSLDVSQFFSSNAMQKIQVNKGSSSSETNPSSLSGSIEIETLKINKNFTSFSGILGGYNNYNINFLSTKKINNKSGILFQFGTNGQNAIDSNNDGIAESPKLRNNFSTIAHQFKNDEIKINTRIDLSQNSRQGGSIIDNKTNTIGNPFNFLNLGGNSQNSYTLPDGTVETYNSGTAGFLEAINNTRLAIQTSAETNQYTFGGIASILNRDNFYSGNKYQANETNFFITGARKFQIRNLKLKFGTDFQHQKLASTVENTAITLQNPDGYSYSIATLFGNAQYSHDKFDINLSNRTSYHSTFGILPVFRSKFNFHHNENITSTASFGTAFITPSSSFEQNHELITANITQLQRNVTKPTESLNFSYNTTFSYRYFTANLNYNYNKISNIAILALHEDENDIHGEFKTLSGFYQNQGIGFDITILPKESLFLTFSGEKYLNDLSNLENEYFFLSRPEYKLSTQITKKYKNNTFNLTSTLFGQNNLRQFYGALYNLSGQRLPEFSPSYMMLDFSFAKDITKKHKIFFGIENIMDFIQVRTSPQIAIKEHHAGEYDLHNINSWGPVRGRFFYAGFKSEL